MSEKLIRNVIDKMEMEQGCKLNETLWYGSIGEDSVSLTIANGVTLKRNNKVIYREDRQEYHADLVAYARSKALQVRLSDDDVEFLNSLEN